MVNSDSRLLSCQHNWQTILKISCWSHWPPQLCLLEVLYSSRMRYMLNTAICRLCESKRALTLKQYHLLLYHQAIKQYIAYEQNRFICTGLLILGNAISHKCIASLLGYIATGDIAWVWEPTNSCRMLFHQSWLPQICHFFVPRSEPVDNRGLHQQPLTWPVVCILFPSFTGCINFTNDSNVHSHLHYILKQ